MLTKQELRQLGDREMMNELQKSRHELLKATFEIRTGTSKATHSVKNLKRYIATVLTISKEVGAKPPVAAKKMEAPTAEKMTMAEAPKKTMKKTAAPAKKAAAPKAKKAPAKK